MASERPFPPSPRRRALARHAGVTAASPVVVGGVAFAVAIGAVVALGRAAADRIGAAIAAACRGEPALGAGDVVPEVLAIAVPVVGAAAIAAVLAQLAQTRAVWLPRRRVDGAPVVPAARVRRAWLELASATVVGGVVLGWLWWCAPQIAALSSLPLAGAAAIASAAATLAIAWIALAAVDAFVRYAAVTGALRMTAREKRDDDRLAAADPRWRQLRTRLASPPRDAVAGATLLLLGDDLAVAIAWDAVRRPIPTRTASGRGPLATQLLGLARRHRVPVHRDPALAAALAGDGPVPEAHWPRVAEIVAAVKR